MTAPLRLVWIGRLLDFKQLGRSAFDAVLQAVWPISSTTGACVLLEPEVAGLVGREVAIGTIYAVAGFFLLRTLEHLSRRHATLERA